MNGRTATYRHWAALAACLLVLVGAQLVASAEPPASGRRGAREVSDGGGLISFSEMAADEARSGRSPQGPRAARPRPKARSGARPLVSGSQSLELQPASTAEADLSFAPASAGPSPAPASSFLGLLDNASTYNPDTQGAIGTNHVVTMLSSEVRIHTRQGVPLSTVSLTNFWGRTEVYDPRILYDPFSHRWIACAVGSPSAAGRALLVAVSMTADPGGTWNRRSVPAGLEGNVFIESPNMGMTKDWITIQLNAFDQTNFLFHSSEIRAFNKQLLYSGGAASAAFFRDTNAITEYNAAVPAINYDDTFATNFLVANWVGNGNGIGFLRLYSISGPVGGELFNDYGTNGLLVAGTGSPNPPWDDYPMATYDNFLPQQGTTEKIFVADSRIQNVVYRAAGLWCVHHVFLPVTAGSTVPTRAAVQWWNLTTGGSVLQRGRIDDPTGIKSYAFPSIAVNQYEDVLIGYTRFGANQYPSANYSYRGFEDAFSSLRSDVVLKAGEAKYFVDAGGGLNYWGDWSATVVDPLNDTDLWTLQEYASAPVGGVDRWGTWWGQIGPQTSLSLTATDAPDPVIAGANVTYSIRVTNNYPLIATGAKAVTTLPAGAVFVSAVASQGSCTHSNGVVTCRFGDLIEEASATATVVARLNQSGQATATIVASGNGPDESPANNTVQVATTVSAAADMTVLLSGTPDPVTLNNTLTYAVIVTNQGPSAATSVQLTNTLPPGVTFLSANTAQGSCSQSAGVVRCTIGSVNAGAAVTVSIAVRPPTSGLLTNRAQVGASSLDPNQANNTVTVVTKANAAPVIQNISARSIPEDSTMGPLTFTVSDAETVASSLTVVAVSSDQNIVPDGNIVLTIVPNSGGTNRTITVTPRPNAFGDVTITRTVTDLDGVSTSTPFVLSVLDVNDPPAITDIPDQSAAEDSVLGPITFTVGDIETAAGALTVSGASLNTGLIPNGNIVIGPPVGGTRTVTIKPATNQTGTATIRITVSDGLTTTNDTFVVTVTDVNDLPTVSDIQDRSINEDGSTGAIPFTVGDIETSVGSLNPSGTSSNPNLVPDTNITFGGTGANRTVTVRPATNQFGSATIRVSIQDGNGGSTNDTFVVTVNPVNDPPTLGGLGTRNLTEDPGLQTVALTNVTGGPINEPQTIEVTATSDNPALIPNPVTVNYTSPATTGSLTFTPVANSNGTANITVTTRDGGSSNNVLVQTFTVNVAAVNDAPTITDIPNRAIDEDGTTGPVPFQISDIDSPLSSLSIVGRSSDTNLVPDANIAPGGFGANRTLSVTPAPDRSGDVTITVFVTDGVTTNSDSFVLTVRNINDPPVISGINNRVINEDAATNISFTIGDPDTALASLTLLASSSNPSLFPNITFGGTGADRTINLVPATNQAGNATITATVSDGIGGSNSVSFTVTVQAVNDLPTVARPSDVSVAEDAPPQVVVLGGITSGAPNESQTLSVWAESGSPSIVGHPTVGYTNGNLTGVLTFRPVTNANGTAVITVFVSDGQATNSQNFNATVQPVNDLPFVSEFGEQTIDEDTTAVFNLHVDDAETPADQLSIVIASSNPELLDESGIQLAGTGTNRTLRLTPFPDASGSSTFITIDVTDGSNAVTSTSFELVVRPVNDLPSLGGLADTTVNRSASARTLNVPFTVNDPESLPSDLIVTASSSNQGLVGNGTVSVTGTGTARTLNLTITANQFGTTVITLVAKDGPQVNAGAVTNSFVLRVNDLPTLSSIGPRSMNGNTISNFTFTVGDSETSAGSLTAFAFSSNPAVVPNSGLNVTGNTATRTLSVTPVTGQSGTATISVVVQDADGGSATNGFVLTVLRIDGPPTISNIANTNVLEDSVLVVPFTIGDAESPLEALQVTAVSSNLTLLPALGITPGGSLANRTLTLTPAPNQTGTVTVTVRVTDTNGNVASDDFVLTVTGNNDGPTLSGLPNLTIEEDSSTGPLPVTVGDVETTPGTLSLTALSSNTGLVPHANVVPGGSGVNRTVTVTPVPDQFGTAQITLTLSDGDGGTTNTTFTVSVAPVNDPPTLNGIADQTLGEDAGPRTVVLTGISAGGGENQSLTFSVVSANTNLIPVATVGYTNGNSTAVLNYTSAPNATGSSLLSVQISDGAGSNSVMIRSFVVTVTNLNDRPFISDIGNQLTIEDVPLTVPFSINDTETPPPGLTLTASSSDTTLVANTNIVIHGSGTNRSLTLTPTRNASGVTTITVTVSDGLTNATDTFQLTVTATNDPPTLDTIPNTTVTTTGGNPTFNVGLTGITSGAPNESQSLSVSVSANPSMATVPTATFSGTTGNIAIRPGNNVTGSWLMTVTVSDGQASVVRTFTFTAKASGNVLPTISIIPAQTINEDTVLSALPFTVRDNETGAAGLSVVAVSTNETLVPNANISLGGSGTDRTITVVPALNQFGTTAIRLTVTDGSFGSSNLTFTLTVNPANDAPTIQSIGTQIVNEDAVAGPIQVFVADAESSASLVVTATSGNQALVPNASIVVGGSGTNRALILTPAANQNGSAIITVNVSDGVLSTNTQFTLQVNPANDAPTISDIADQTISEDGTTAAIPFTIGDVETPAASLSVTVTGSNTNQVPLTVALGGSGANRTLTLTPAPNVFGVTTVTVTVSDGTNQANDTFVLRVNPANDPPTLNVIADVTVPFNGAAQSVNLTGITSGATNEAQTLIVAASSSNPSVIPHPAVSYGSPGATGSLSLAPVRGATGSATITVTVNDSQAQSNTVTRTFVVTVMETAPALRIEFLGGMAVISWPTENAQGWMLQSSADLMNANAWSAVATAPVVVNNRYTVTNAPGSAMRAYRLCNSCSPGSGPGSPTLTIRRTGTTVTLAWPMAAGNFVLEETDALAPAPLQWRPVTQAPSVVDSRNTVEVEAGSRKFYRLRNQ